MAGLAEAYEAMQPPRPIGACKRCGSDVFLEGQWQTPRCSKCGLVDSPAMRLDVAPPEVFASVQKQLSDAVTTIGRLIEDRDRLAAEWNRRADLCMTRAEADAPWGDEDRARAAVYRECAKEVADVVRAVPVAGEAGERTER